MKKVISLLTLLAIALFSFTSLDASMLNQEESFNNLVIFIKFADETDYIAPYGLSHYEDLFNADDQVSLKDYYLEATYDQLTINSYLVSENSTIVFYQDTHLRSYYDVYDSVSNPNGVTEDDQAVREHALLKRAVDFVEENNYIPDDLELDSNDDGSIDSITFMVSGEDSGWNSLLWPHMWNLYSYQDNDYNFTFEAPSINGVYALDYTFELLGNSTSYYNQVQVGVLAHETFHLLSAPDLYHYYEYTYVTPVGDWGIMEGTSDIPSHMLGYMKYAYGNWIDEIETITSSGTYTLYPMQESADNIYKVPTGYPDEYIYLEYRDDAGLYESELPDTGLLVYRVNSTLYGNESGSYDADGNPTDEIWVFRPDMDDETYPIVLEDTDFYIDGTINDAALSDTGRYDSAGGTQEIMLFNGAGEIINITITNADEHDGYITFDVTLPPSITLNTKTDLATDNVLLLDHESMDYTVDINNLPNDAQVYYTLDGSAATSESTLLTTTSLSIDAENNVISLAIYKDGELLQSFEREFTFASSIESAHDPYGNELNTFWYLDFGITTEFEVTSDSRGFLETEYDYLHIKDNVDTTSYTGDSLGTLTENYTSDFLVINFSTDQLVDEDYGFKLELEVHSGVSFDLVGEPIISLAMGSNYSDLGSVISGMDEALYTYETNNTVDTMIPGTYQITYNLLNNDGETVKTLVRTVEILDNIAPVVTLNGEDTVNVELGSTYEESGINAFDNFDTDLTEILTGHVNTNIVGTTVLTYTVTDDYDNSTTVTRTVIVQDTTAPTLTLEPGLDTIMVGDSWVQADVLIDEKTDTSKTITGTVDNTVAGQYIITYEVTDESGNTTSALRYVTVLDNHKKEITCDPFISTLEKNKTTDIGDCYLDNEKMEKDTSNISYLSSGTYEITYTLEVDGHTYKKSQFIYILEDGPSEVAYIERKEYL